MRQSIFAPLFGLFLIMACSNNSKDNVTSEKILLPMSTDEINTAPVKNKDTATFGSGCFWCTEAVFQQVKGVDTVISGYSGGHIAKPTYKQVCSGTTGHAEVLQIVFNPALMSYSQLLEMFWYSHDPTTLNRQGNDEGTQYRSVVFYHNEQQKKEAEFYKKKLEEQKVFNSPIVTEISPLINFYPAEDYHQNYYNENSSQPYCMYIVRPKLEKFKKAFATKLK
jgi:peptide-methionine (S)-S-oxide reductase